MTPTLEFVFELSAQVGAPDKFPINRGLRRIVPVLGGTLEGPLLHGKLAPGGVDYQVIHDDGFTEIEARYVVETDQGERIYVINAGMRHAAPEVMAELNAGRPVDPAKVYFRAIPTFETAAPRLQWLTRSLFVTAGERYPDGVKIRFYRIT